MLIAMMKEDSLEMRVAITPSAVLQYRQLGFEVACESQTGIRSGFFDEDYQKAGAIIFKDRKTLLQETDILLAVSEPHPANLKGLRPEALLIGHIENNKESNLLHHCLKERLSIFSMNYIPAIEKAQSMNSLASQSKLAGYRAVIEALSYFKRSLPKTVTADTTIPAATVLVLGAGFAGLQAIQTAISLGARVIAFDLNDQAKDSVLSLGAEFISQNPPSESKPEDNRHTQAELLDEYASLSDLILCCLFEPGKKAPKLLREKTIQKMKAGSVILDMAIAYGGNCELTEPEQIITEHGVLIIGHSNLASRVPFTASELYSHNLLQLVKYILPKAGKFVVDEENEIIKAILLCHDGQYLPLQY